jgi:hypothetical protein
VNRRGDQRDVQVRKWLEDLGFTLGSRRKIPGPGDLLALRPHPNHLPTPTPVAAEVLLVEVKSTAQGPWEHFGPAERLALAEAAQKATATGTVAWWPAYGPLQWYVVTSADAGVPWEGPGTMFTRSYEQAPPTARIRPARPGVVAPPSAGPGVVGTRALRRGGA